MSRSRSPGPRFLRPPSDSQQRESLQHGPGQSELAAAASSGRKAARGRLTYSSRPSATHPQKPRASRPGAPGRRRSETGLNAPVGDNGIPSSRAGLCRLWFVPGVATSIL